MLEKEWEKRVGGQVIGLKKLTDLITELPKRGYELDKRAVEKAKEEEAVFIKYSGSYPVPTTIGIEEASKVVKLARDIMAAPFFNYGSTNNPIIIPSNGILNLPDYQGISIGNSGISNSDGFYSGSQRVTIGDPTQPNRKDNTNN